MKPWARRPRALFERMAETTGAMIGQWMAVGFVHGVMNTDNFNITGETFDFGPWRFLEKSEPNFVAAYFDQQGLYRFGRQPAQGLWALQQLGGALSLVAESDDLSQALSAYEPAYQASFANAHIGAYWAWRPARHCAMICSSCRTYYGWLTESGASWPQTFFDWFGGAASLGPRRPQSAIGSLLHRH